MDDNCYLTSHEAVLLCTGEMEEITADERNNQPLEKRAERVLDRLTFGRIRKMKEIPEAVKRCVAEIIILENRAREPAVKSYSTDGYSETYAQPLTRETVDAMEANLVMEYLADERDDRGVPLLYLGV